MTPFSHTSCSSFTKIFPESEMRASYRRNGRAQAARQFHSEVSQDARVRELEISYRTLPARCDITHNIEVRRNVSFGTRRRARGLKMPRKWRGILIVFNRSFPENSSRPCRPLVNLGGPGIAALPYMGSGAGERGGASPAVQSGGSARPERGGLSVGDSSRQTRPGPDRWLWMRKATASSRSTRI